jgi:hypothetical protein
VLNVSDISPKKSNGIDTQVAAIQGDIARLEHRLKIPANFRGLVTGTTVGMLLGNYTGAAIGALAGYHLGAKHNLTQDDREIIVNQIKVKKAYLEQLKAKQSITRQAEKGILQADQLAGLQYEQYEFDGRWEELFGYPAKPFHCMVFGRPKNGKSIFSFQFANYLSQFGKVLYIASEEGFGGTLQKKIMDFGLESNKMVQFSDAKGMDRMRKDIPGHEFVFIDSVNYAALEVEDVERLKDENPGTSFITIQQATKGGQFRGSQEYAHNCDMIVEVISGIAYQQGRFQAASEYVIFDGPEKKVEKKEKKENKEQLNLFDI